MSDTPAPIIDVKATVDAMRADAADPTPGAPLPPQAPSIAPAEVVQAVPPPKRGRGRPAGSGSKRGAGGKFTSKAPAAPEAPAQGEIRPMSSYESAAMVNGLMFGIVAVIGGDEARPTEQEATLCNGALGDYLNLHPEFAIRPEFMLAAVYLPYFGRALTRPTAREKLSIIGGRAWSAIKSIFTRKKEQPVNAAAS